MRKTHSCDTKVGIADEDTWPHLKRAFLRDEKELQQYYVMHPGARFGGYGHMSAEGNKLMAKLIAQEIRRSGLIAGPPNPQ